VGGRYVGYRYTGTILGTRKVSKFKKNTTRINPIYDIRSARRIFLWTLPGAYLEAGSLPELTHSLIDSEKPNPIPTL